MIKILKIIVYIFAESTLKILSTLVNPEKKNPET